MITDDKVARINALAKKAREQGLSEEEKAEQAALRREYVDAVKASLEGHLHNTTVIRPDGSKQKLTKRD